MTKTKWGLGLLGATLMGGALACSSELADDTPTSVIKLAAVLDRTGAAGTPSWTEAAKMATSHINEALERAGKKVRFELQTADSKSSPDVALEHARGLVSKGAKGVVIDLTSDYIALIKAQYSEDESERLNVPIVGIATTSPAVLNPEAVIPDPVTQAAFRDADRWSFRTTMATSAQGLVLAQILKALGDDGDVDGNGKVKVVVVLSDEPYGQGSTGAVQGAMAQLLPDAVIETVAIDPSVSLNDIGYYGTIFEKSVDDKNEQSGETDGPPDMVITAALPDFAISYTKSYAQANSTVPLVNMGSLRSGKAVETLGADAEDKEGCSVIQADIGSSGERFTTDFREWTGSSTLANFDSGTYDAVMALALASLIASNDLEDPAEVTPEAIRDAVRSTSSEGGEAVGSGVDELLRAVRLIDKGEAIDYAGASGPLDFDENGNVKVRWVHFSIQDGAFKDDVIYDCVESATCEARE